MTVTAAVTRQKAGAALRREVAKGAVMAMVAVMRQAIWETGGTRQAA